MLLTYDVKCVHEFLLACSYTQLAEEANMYSYLFFVVCTSLLSHSLSLHSSALAHPAVADAVALCSYDGLAWQHSAQKYKARTIW